MDDVSNQIERVNAYLAGEAGKNNYGQLLRFAQGLSARYVWYSRANSTPPSGKSVEDIVDEALWQVLITDPDDTDHRAIPNHVEIGYALRMILRSKMSGLANSAENKTVLREADIRRQSEDGQETPFDNPIPFWENAEPDLDEETRAAISLKVSQFIRYGENDRLVHSMLVLMKDENIFGLETLAERLDVNVDDLYKANRRIKAAVIRFNKFERK